MGCANIGVHWDWAGGHIQTQGPSPNPSAPSPAGKSGARCPAFRLGSVGLDRPWAFRPSWYSASWLRRLCFNFCSRAEDGSERSWPSLRFILDVRCSTSQSSILEHSGLFSLNRHSAQSHSTTRVLWPCLHSRDWPRLRLAPHDDRPRLKSPPLLAVRSLAIVGEGWRMSLHACPCEQPRFNWHCGTKKHTARITLPARFR